MRKERTNETSDTYFSEMPVGAWSSATEPRSAPRKRRSEGRIILDGREVPIIPLARSERPTQSPDPDESESQSLSLVERLRQRKIVQWLLAYLAMAAIVLQLTEALADMWGIPVPVQRGISLALAFGILPALVLAWYHGELGRQRMTCTEVGIVGLLLSGSALGVWHLCGI